MKPTLFIWIPRTAGTSIWGAIENNNRSTQRVGVAPDRIFDSLVEHTTFQHCHVSALISEGMFLESWLEDRFTFAFVRNPWARLVSVYHHLKQGRPDQKRAVGSLSFSQFVGVVCAGDIPPVGRQSRDGLSYANPQVDWLRDSKGNWLPDFVGRVEAIKKGWRHVKEATGLKGTIGRSNRSNHRPYQDYYNRDTRELVARRFAEEIELWGYAFQ